MERFLNEMSFLGFMEEETQKGNFGYTAFYIADKKPGLFVLEDYEAHQFFGKNPELDCRLIGEFTSDVRPENLAEMILEKALDMHHAASKIYSMGKCSMVCDGNGPDVYIKSDVPDLLGCKIRYSVLDEKEFDIDLVKADMIYFVEQSNGVRIFSYELSKDTAERGSFDMYALMSAVYISGIVCEQNIIDPAIEMDEKDLVIPQPQGNLAATWKEIEALLESKIN